MRTTLEIVKDVTDLLWALHHGEATLQDPRIISLYNETSDVVIDMKQAAAR